MSRGMQQKVAITRALLVNPPLLLLDEPTTGLDPKSRRDVQTFLENLRSEHGTTILLTSHDMAETERLCSRIGFIAHGRLIAEGTAEELKRRSDADTLDDAFIALAGEKLDDADAKRRLHTNPLRTLDSKNPMVQEVVAQAPSLMDYLGAESLEHFDGLKRLLAAAGVSFTLNPKLVRGLDYYNLTVFEWIAPQLGAQGTVCGGGRYDGLFAQIGGKHAPACGFAMGNERLIGLLRDAGRSAAPRAPHAYVLHQGEGTLEYALKLAEELRAQSLSVLLHAGGGSFKSQMKRADASGARYALIVGDEELAAGEVSVKPLRAEEQQFRLKRERVAQSIKGG